MGVSKCNGLVQFHSGTRLSFWVGFGMTEGGETVAGCSADDKRGRGVQWWDPLFLHANIPCALYYTSTGDGMGAKAGEICPRGSIARLTSNVYLRNSSGS